MITSRGTEFESPSRPDTLFLLLGETTYAAATLRRTTTHTQDEVHARGPYYGARSVLRVDAVMPWDMEHAHRTQDMPHGPHVKARSGPAPKSPLGWPAACTLFGAGPGPGPMGHDVWPTGHGPCPRGMCYVPWHVLWPMGAVYSALRGTRAIRKRGQRVHQVVVELLN